MAQGFDGAFVVLAEAHIIADDDDLAGQCLNEVGAHELLGALGREVEVVVLDEQRIDAGVRDEVGLLLGARDHQRRLIRAVDRARVRVEGHGHGAQRSLPGQCRYGLENGLVTAVDPIEVAQGHDGADIVGPDLIQSVIKLHSTFAPSVHRLRLSQRCSHVLTHARLRR